MKGEGGREEEGQQEVRCSVNSSFVIELLSLF